MVRLGAVNADEHRSLGGQYGVKGFPTIKIFGSNKNSPSDYKGEESNEGRDDHFTHDFYFFFMKVVGLQMLLYKKLSPLHEWLLMIDWEGRRQGLGVAGPVEGEGEGEVRRMW